MSKLHKWGEKEQGTQVCEACGTLRQQVHGNDWRYLYPDGAVEDVDGKGKQPPCPDAVGKMFNAEGTMVMALPMYRNKRGDLVQGAWGKAAG